MKYFLKRNSKRIISAVCIVTLLLGLVSTIDLARGDSAYAAVFAVKGDGVTAPAYNKNSIPALDTTGTRQYYFGQCGNAFYGVTDNSDKGVWELVDTDARLDGKDLRSAWSIDKSNSYGDGKNGQRILDYTNDQTDICFSEADKTAMITMNVDTIDKNTEGQGAIAGAYMWPLSYTQATANIRLCTRLLNKVAEDQIWTRSFAGKNGDRLAAYMIIPTNRDKAMLYNQATALSKSVCPAFKFNTKKIIMTRNASSGAMETSLSSVNKVGDDTDLKFLVNIGTAKSNFDVPYINGKKLSNVKPGTTYSFNYVDANTGLVGNGKNYVSAIIYDKDWKIVYYGNLKELENSIYVPDYKTIDGTAQITIPTDLNGTYTLALFQEEKCDAYNTDYASQPVYAQFTTIKDTELYVGLTSASSAPSNNTVKLDDTITSDMYTGTVTWGNGTTNDTDKDYMYVVPAVVWDSWSEDERTEENVKGLTEYNGGKSIKLDKRELLDYDDTYSLYSIYFPRQSANASYFAKKYTYDIASCESSVSLSQTTYTQNQKDLIQVGDAIDASMFGGSVLWSDGSTTDTKADNVYVVPASVWDNWGDDEKTKLNVELLANNGKAIKLDANELNGANTYKLYAVYFPEYPTDSTPYFTKEYTYRVATPYAVGLAADYVPGYGSNQSSPIADKVDYGTTITNHDVKDTVSISDSTTKDAELNHLFVVATSVWGGLSDSVKNNEASLAATSGVNSVVVPSMDVLGDTASYSITVVYFDYSDFHQAGVNGVDCGNCTRFSTELNIPLDVSSKYQAMLDDINAQIAIIKGAIGITDPNFDNLSISEKLKVIDSEVDKLIDLKNQKDSQLAEYQQAIADINNKLFSGNLSAEETATLQKNLEAILKEIDRIQTENAQLTTKITSLESQLQELQKQLDDALANGGTGDLAEANETIKELNTKVDSLEATIKDQNNEVADLTTKITGLQTELENKNAEIEEIKKQAEADKLKTEEEKQKLEEEKQKLEEEKKQAELEKQQAEQDKQKAELDNEQLEKDKTTLEEEKATLEKEKQSATTESAEKVEDLNNDVQNLNKTVNQQTSDIANLNATNASLKSQISSYQAALDKKNAEYEALAKEKSSAKTTASANTTNTAKTTSATSEITTSNESYTVRFETNGGSSISDQTVTNGFTATEPDDPARSCYKFGGWYSDSGFSKPYSFSKPVKSDMTLYAKWSIIKLPGIDDTEEAIESTEEVTESTEMGTETELMTEPETETEDTVFEPVNEDTTPSSTTNTTVTTTESKGGGGLGALCAVIAVAAAAGAGGLLTYNIKNSGKKK